MLIFLEKNIIKYVGMEIKINSNLEYLFLIFVGICLISCHGEIQKKEKYGEETIAERKIDTVLEKEAFRYQKVLLGRFGESSVKELDHEAYQLQFYSSHGFGKSIKFEKKQDSCLISVKCIVKKDWFPDCEEYKVETNLDEWNELEKMIYEFNFWTIDAFRVNKNVLDGAVYFLEGNRPKAKNVKTYKLIGRGSPKYDKMGALCDYIIELEDQLKFKYKQINKIK